MKYFCAERAPVTAVNEGRSRRARWAFLERTATLRFTRSTGLPTARRPRRRNRVLPALKWSSAKSDRAVETGRRKIARGERPLYRFRVTEGFGGMLEAQGVELPNVDVLARSQTDVLRAAREEIAITLGVRDDDFDVTIDETD